MPKFIVFTIRDRRYAVTMSVVGGIHPPVPAIGRSKPNDVVEMITVAGRALPFLDLGRLWGEKRSARRTSTGKILVVAAGRLQLALLVDRVDNVLNVQADCIIPLPRAITGAARKLFPQVVQLDDELLPVLDTAPLRDVIEPGI